MVIMIPTHTKFNTLIIKLLLVFIFVFSFSASSIAQSCPTTNIITGEFNGTFGTTSTNRDLQNPPGGGYIYKSPTNTAGGQYVVTSQAVGSQNWNSNGQNIAGHTTGTSTDAFLLVNGSTSVGTFYSQTVAVQPNSSLTASVWMRNWAGAQFTADPPSLSLQIYAADGTTLLGSASRNNIPNSSGWLQASATVNTGSNTQIIVKIRNTSTGANGNDFAIDDLSITSSGSCLVSDYGDAPDTSTGTSSGNYQTSISDGGPSHFLTSTLKLGTNVDADTGSLQNTAATADDNDGSSDDEDGVTMPVSTLAGANITVSVTVNGSGRLNGWFDWNNDGDFLDFGEQITNDQSVSTGTTNLSVSIPVNAAAGPKYSRFRLCSTAGNCNTPTGVASDGEVEDYQTLIIIAPDLTIDKSHTGNFSVGTSGTYQFAVNNIGGLASSGTITVTDTLPTGLTIPDGAVTLGGAQAANWTCNTAANIITCTSLITIAASGTSTFTFPVNVGLDAPLGTNSITNTANVSGGDDSNTANNSDSDPTTILSPNLTITKADTANFTVGSNGTYQFTVGNTGTAATSGTITVVDTLPTGLTIPDGAVTSGGAQSANWTCTAASNVVTCTSTTAIAATSGTSVFTFPVIVGLDAPIGTNAISNTANVSGGNEPTVNNTNNSSTDTTTVLGSNLTITKADTANFTLGTTGTYQFTVKNIGTAAISGAITVIDTLPTGLTVPDGAVTEGGAQAANWTCTAASNVVTCTSSTAIAATSGQSIFTFPVTVGLDAPIGTNALSNTASVSGVNEPTANHSDNTGTDTTTVLASNLSIGKTHTPASFVRGSTGTYSLTVSNTGTGATSGTITVVDTLPTGLTIPDGAITEGGAQAANWTCTAASNVVTCTSTTAIAATSGTSVFSFVVNVAADAPLSMTNNVTVSGGSEPTTNNGNNSASDVTPIAMPDLTLNKSHTGNFTVGATGTYQFAVSNIGAIASSGTITVTDTLPTGLTIADGAITEGGAQAANWTCTAASNVVTCTSSTAIAATSGVSTFTFPVTVGLNAPLGTSSLTNTADVSGGGEVNTANNSDSDPTTILSPNLTITKADTANFTIGGTGTYQFTVRNIGTAASSGTITVVDTLPTGLTRPDGAITEGGAQAANWTCTAASNVITCTSTTAIAATSGTSVFTFPVNVGLDTPVGTNALSNTANVTGANEATANNSDNTGTDTTTVLSPNLTVAKSHTGNFTVGSTGTYQLTVGNSGTAATSGTITITDTLPIGLTVNGGAVGVVTKSGTNAANWTCNSNAASPQVITCTSSTAIAISGTSVFSFVINVGLSTAAGTNSVTNSATVSGGTEGTSNNGNNTANDPTTILSPDLTITKADTANFITGTSGTYQFTVGNSGTSVTTGTITLSDTLPTGLTVPNGALTLGGAQSANWSCIAASNVITCTSSTAIAISGSSVFTFSVNVGLNAPLGSNSLPNTATISGGGEATSNIGNNSGTDTTSVLSPNLTIDKTHTEPYLPGSPLTYTMKVGNSGTTPTSGTITLSDTLPTGLSISDGTVTLSGAKAANWSCIAASNVITCTSSTAIAINNPSVFSFTVNVAPNAPATVNNTATVSGGSEATVNTGNNSDTDTAPAISTPPNIELVKSCPSPANCTTAPQIPGTDLTYQISFTNDGGQGATNMAIIDRIPDNMDYKLGSAAVNLGTTGLTFVIEYSADYDPLNPTFATWTYTPISGGGGASAGYDRLAKAIRWRVTAGTLSNVSPNNTGDVSFVAKIR